jgi:hypothetical protein
MAHETEASMGALLRGALDDIRDLLREEVALARAELRDELSKAGAAVKGYGGAAATGWFSGLFLLAAIAFGISDGFNWPYWAGFGIVGILLGITAGVLFIAGRASAREIHGLRRTTESVRELKETLR